MELIIEPNSRIIAYIFWIEIYAKEDTKKQQAANLLYHED
jgi:hypothetical protein